MELVRLEVAEPSSLTPSQTQRAKRPTLRRTIRKIDRRVREYRNLMCAWSNDAHGWLDNCQIRMDQLHLVMTLHESWARLVGLPITFGEGLVADAWARDHGLPPLFGERGLPHTSTSTMASAADPGPPCLCVPGAPACDGLAPLPSRPL